MSVEFTRSSIPTTKVIALGSVGSPLTPEQQQSIMPREVPDTVRLYLNGKIDQWFSRKDGGGVVFVLNVTSIEDARELLAVLPLAAASLMSFELIPVGPLFPLGMLL
jgi:hypothetical protein